MTPLVLAAALLAAPPAPGTVLFADDFGRDALGDGWELNDQRRGVSGQSKIVDGKLVMARSPKADHAAVAARFFEYTDAAFRLRFQLRGKQGFGLLMGDPQCKESHAGHVARVMVSPTRVEVRDDKTGVMNLKLRELRQKPGGEAEAATKLLADKTASGAVTVEPGRWHTLTADVVGDELIVAIDDNPVARLKSPGIGHPTKRRFSLSVDRDEVWFDDITVKAAARK